MQARCHNLRIDRATTELVIVKRKICCLNQTFHSFRCQVFPWEVRGHFSNRLTREAPANVDQSSWVQESTAGLSHISNRVTTTADQSPAATWNWLTTILLSRIRNLSWSKRQLSKATWVPEALQTNVRLLSLIRDLLTILTLNNCTSSPHFRTLLVPKSNMKRLATLKASCKSSKLKCKCNNNPIPSWLSRLVKSPQQVALPTTVMETNKRTRNTRIVSSAVAIEADQENW